MTLPEIPALALVRRELLVTLRMKRALLVLALLVAAAVASAVMLLLQSAMGGVASADLSRGFLDLFFGVALLGGAVTVPGLCGGAIVSERQGDTFDLLHGTLLGPRGIVLGKLVNSLGFYTLLLVGMLPVLGVAFFQVGIGWGDLLVRLAVLYASMIACAAMGLLCSTVLRRPVGAIAAAYAAMLCIYGLSSFIVLYFLEVSRSGAGAMLAFLSPTLLISEWVLHLLVSPFTGVILPSLGSRGFLSLRGMTAIESLAAMNIVLCLFVAAYAVVLTLSVLKRPPRRTAPKAEKIIDDAALLEARRVQFPYYLFDPCRRRPMISDRWNPVLAKEFRYGLLGKNTRMIRQFYSIAIVYGLTLLVLALGSSVGVSARTGSMAAIIPQIWVVLIGAPVLIGGVITKEREQGNIEMLRMTTLRPAEIVLGKAGGALISLLPLLVTSFLYAVAVPFLCLYFGIRYTPVAHFFGLSTLAVATVVSVLLCLFASAHCKTTVGGVLAAYAMSGILFVGIPVGCIGFGMASQELAPIVSPAWAYSMVFQGDYSFGIWLGYLAFSGLLSFVFFRLIGSRIAHMSDRGAA